jgi:glycosyltransferase involved in cell wall biosynthesis
MTQPNFSVVIPAYNAPRTIVPAIQSVLSQTRQDLELVVVDDGSTDNTADLAAETEREDSRVRVLRQKNQGVAGARNSGIGATSGRFVSFLDNDDLWLPAYLEQMGTALEANPGAGLAYTDGWSLDDATRQIYKATAMSGSNPPNPPPQNLDAFLVRLIRRNFILSSSTVRRDVLAAVGDFDRRVNGVDDFDLWLRILAAGYEAVRTEGILVIQRERSDSQSKDRLLMASALREVLRRVAEDHPDVPEAGREDAWAQIHTLDREIDGLTGRDSLRAAWFDVRRRLGSAKRRLRKAKRPAFAEPPAEVAAAFPDLSQV